MASGISLHDSCASIWNDMKLKHKHMFITFKINNDREIIVEATGDKNASYDSFMGCFPPDDCRYAVVEVPGTKKLVFIMWAPETATIKAKMMYASTRAGM